MGQEKLDRLLREFESKLHHGLSERTTQLEGGGGGGGEEEEEVGKICNFSEKMEM